jgi:preprotein translocase subunit SecE
MGRLQKKKPAGKKKVKKQKVALKEAAKQKGDTVKVKKVLPATFSSAIKKRQLLPQKKSSSGAAQDNSYFNKALQFLREVKVELKKVAWPTRKQTMGSTVVVIILVMIIALFLGAVDIGLSSLVRIFIQ